MRTEVLQKILARAGVASRRKSEELIRAGRVAVDGKVAELGTSADASRQVITVDGKPIRAPTAHHYIVLNKPAGYLTSRSDPHHTRFVYDLLPRGLRKLVFPVGRLDQNSEGLLLLTSDGELAHRLTHPRYAVPRVYHVSAEGPVAGLEKLRTGAELSDGMAKPESVRLRRRRGSVVEIEIVLREGRKREVRRLCAAAGLSVRRLRRVAYGPIKLADLAVGKWRRLTENEVQALRRIVGLAERQ
jgi:pseudouridine synthase